MIRLRHAPCRAARTKAAALAAIGDQSLSVASHLSALSSVKGARNANPLQRGPFMFGLRRGLIGHGL
jgi:hypothetical protein